MIQGGVYQRACELAFARYCNAQYCIVYGVQTGGRKGSNIAQSYCSIATVWAMQAGGAIKG